MTRATCSALQVPRLEHLPADVAGTRAPTALQLIAASGVHLDPWQAHLVARLFDVDSAGRSAASEAGWLVSRQNGKGEGLMAWKLAHLLAFPRPDGKPKLIMYSAHETKTADEAFERIKQVFMRSRHLMARLAPNGIRVANGQQTITMRNGNRLRFVARSKSSGRGFAADKLILDEAQECSAAAYDALTYTTSAVPDPQTLIVGTAPEPSNNYEVFEAIRDRGRQHTGPRTYWAEWSPTGSEAWDYELEDPLDPQVWAESIPALGTRLKPEQIEEQVERASSLESLERERFSVWRDRAPITRRRLNDVDPEQWAAHADPEAEHVGRVAIAVMLGRGGGYSSIAAASRRANGHVLVQHLRTAQHSAWVAAEVKRLQATLGAESVVVDRRNIVPILTDLDRAGVAYLAMSAPEVAAAFEMIVEGINTGQVDNCAQPELDTSLENAIARKVGASGYTWDQSDPTEPATLIQAATAAHWGLKKLEADRPRELGRTRGIGG